MPSPVIHYCIANKILEHYSLNRNLFIIGNFAPDAHNQTREGRRKAHFQKSNLEYDISAFKNKYMMKGINDFILGYYCHLISDAMSFSNFSQQYLQVESEEEKRNRIRMCYDDYHVLNSKLFDHYQFTKENIFIPKSLYIKEIHTERLSYIISEFQYNFDCSNDKKMLSILKIENVLNEINDIAIRCVRDIIEFKKS